MKTLNSKGERIPAKSIKSLKRLLKTSNNGDIIFVSFDRDSENKLKFKVSVTEKACKGYGSKPKKKGKRRLPFNKKQVVLTRIS